MKSVSIVALVLCCNLAFGQQATFQYRRKLNPISTEGWHSLVLPADIFKNCDREFRDLRLLTLTEKDTVEVPFLLNKRTSEIKREEVELPVLNKSTKDGVLYLMFELKDGQKVNQLDLEFSNPEYFATVKLEGSENKKEWFELTDKQRIFSIHSSNENYQYGVVDFGTTDYHYLRASIQSDVPLSFVHASFRREEIKKGTFVDIPVHFNRDDNKKTKQTTIDIQLDHYRPVSDVKFDIENGGDYYRFATLSRLVDSTQTPKGWIKNYEVVNEGYLTSFRPNEFTVDDESTSALKLNILNFDNAPLQLKNVTVAGPVVELITNLKPGDTYLYYGNRSLDYPSYDLVHFAEKVPENVPLLGLGVEENITVPGETQNPLFENKFWLWGIMIAVIGVLGFFTLRMMKNNG